MIYKKYSMVLLVSFLMTIVFYEKYRANILVDREAEKYKVLMNINKLAYVKEINDLKINYETQIDDLNNDYNNKIKIIRMETRAQSKAQKAVSVIPVVGVVTLGVSEKKDFDKWKKNYPDGTIGAYAKEVGSVVIKISIDKYYELKDKYFVGR
ncbi:hypothetical protein [Aliamphritea ceti]|uniref:hypothetical protein n=1 Tax=Aliamphritea ceti TaxID=1524258 RepID=UPI0021C49D44|nr:hypothetical protein [Aliamphritea ceti]